MEDITWLRGDTNFSLSVETYFTSERSERVNDFLNSQREISYLKAAM